MSDLYTEIVTNTRALIMVLDAKGRVAMFNAACERISGYRFEEVKDLPIWDFLLPPEEIEGVRTVLAELFVGRCPNTHENHWVTKSGERRFIEWSDSAVTDELGRVTYVIGTGIDVTERRAAERALQASEARFRDLTENLPLVFWTREMPSGRISYISRAYEKIWGRSLGDLDEAYHSFVQSIHPDDRETLFRQIQRETELNESTEAEYRIVRPDRTVRWIHSRAIPLQDETGQVCRIVGFADDITDLRRAEQIVHETQQRQKALLDNMPEAAWMKDLHGRYIETNRVFLDRVSAPGSGLGARVGTQYGKFEGRTDFDIFPADYARKLAEEDRGVIESKKPSVTERHIGAGAYGRWIEVTKAPVFDESGAVTGTVGIARDITGRKLAEVHRAARDAVLRDALVKEIHHRIKNNLQGVIGLMQQLATEHPGSASLLDAVVTRVNAIASMHGLYGATGQHELRLEQILLTLVSSLRVIYADLPLRLSISSSLVSVRVKESEIVPLALVVNELIMNAIKHSHSIIGGDPVEIALERAANCARIVVHGHAGRLPANFDFDGGAGLGTGLSLVKSLLPPEGAVLRFENTGDRTGVKAELTLCPPVIALSAAST